MRHNVLRDTEADLFSSVCKNVIIEPELISIERVDIDGNDSNQARLDISAIGLWNHYQKSMFDIRVTYPNAESYLSKSLPDLYKMHEEEKKRSYNDRVLNCERATFSPMVFSTSGGMGRECQRVNQRLAELIANKKGERYSDTIKYIRNRLRFALLRATVTALRGCRGKRIDKAIEIEDIHFNLIPDE